MPSVETQNVSSASTVQAGGLSSAVSRNQQAARDASVSPAQINQAARVAAERTAFDAKIDPDREKTRPVVAPEKRVEQTSKPEAVEAKEETKVSSNTTKPKTRRLDVEA